MERGLTVAEACVNGEIEMRPNAGEVEVVAGRPFLVRFQYKVYEASYDEESWRFKLTARLHGEEDAVSEVTHHDRRVFRDDTWSSIRQVHVCPEPGQYILDFEAEAEMTRRAWGDPQPPREERWKQVAGQVTIRAV